jgi:hypothetical protein
MRVNGMMVMMVVIMRVTVIMVEMVIMMMIRHFEPAHPSAKMITIGTIRDIRAGRVRPLTFDMMVMAFLHRADLGLEPQHLRAVLTQNTGRRWHIAKGRMAVTILCGDLFDS